MRAAERERFCAVLANGPLLKGDAVVILAGEDAGPRLQVGFGLIKTGAAKMIVLSGGRSEPPRRQSAQDLHQQILGLGVSPDRIVLETSSQNTREQAVNVVALAQEYTWARILLVASPYHQVRAFLTFLQAMREAKADETLQMIPVPAAQTSWFEKPVGSDESRLQLLDREFTKVEAYHEHMASYVQGLEYLRHWEGKA
jgi:uncharacterized SAM-binding protein YcdF (DUF218 family)